MAVAVTMLAAGPVAAGPGAPSVEPLHWTPCGRDPTAECASLTVPVDWASRSGQTFELALARRKATDPTRRIGSLVVNPGGPGVSGVQMALDADRHLSARTRERFDIVGFDPRGVGRSAPIRCATNRPDPGPLYAPRTADQFALLRSTLASFGAGCRAESGPIFDHLDATQVARDIEAIRLALGEGGLNYYGVSYGTVLGQAYAELFPRNIRAMILDSVADHSLGTLDWLRSNAAAVEDSFREFASWCGRDTSCALHGHDVGALFDDLYRRAERGELADPANPSHRLTGYELSLAANVALIDPQWAAFAGYLAALAGGGATPVPVAAAAAPVASPFPAIFCADWRADIDNYRQYRAYRGAIAAAAPHVRIGAAAWYGVGSCLDWPAAVGNPQHRLSIHGAPPILLMNALHDPSTNYAGARNIAAQIPGAVLLTYDGWGHVAYTRTDCTRSAADRYLAELIPPAPGTHCPPAPLP